MPTETVPPDAKPTLEQARREVEQAGELAPPPWRPFFADLAPRLFDPALRIDTLRRTHGMQGGFYTQRFQAVFTHRPKEYLIRVRITTAGRLLRATALDVATVGRLVGMPARSTFESTFHRIEGHLPAVIASSRELTLMLCQPRTEQEALDALARCFALTTRGAAAAREIRAVRRAHPSSRAQPSDLRYELERLATPLFWRHARELPAKEWPQALANPMSLATPELFEHLCQESRTAGEHNRQRHLALAELALESLLALRRLLGEERVQELEKRWRAEANSLRDQPTARFRNP